MAIMTFQSTQQRQEPTDSVPKHAARDLTGGGDLAQIVLKEKTYTLRITRAGKLILTK